MQSSVCVEMCEIVDEPWVVLGPAALSEVCSFSQMGLLGSIKHPGMPSKLDFGYFLLLSNVHTMHGPQAQAKGRSKDTAEGELLRQEGSPAFPVPEGLWLGPAWSSGPKGSGFTLLCPVSPRGAQ